MTSFDASHTNKEKLKRDGRKVDALLFIVVAVVWIVLDRLSKSYFDSTYELGESSVSSYLLFHFRLVHNTGMAWGMFDDSTFVLGIFSCLVCAIVLVVWLMWPRLLGRTPSALETLGLSLLFAGGIGNAIDRFSQGYVVDFIEFTFIDFPVFNVADMGVTCGIVLAFIGYLFAEHAAFSQGQTESQPRSASADEVEKERESQSRTCALSEKHGAASSQEQREGKRRV